MYPRIVRFRFLSATGPWWTVTLRHVTLTGRSGASIVRHALDFTALTSENARMVDGVKDRVRVQLSREATECPRCERQELRLMRSRDVREGLAKVNPFWDAHEKTYERCKVCGFRRAVTGAAARHEEASPARGRRPVTTALGWTAVVLMIVLIAVLTVVLTGMLLVVSVWLTVAVPLVVLLVVIGVAAYARRG